jgi:hypothetical protein
MTYLENLKPAPMQTAAEKTRVECTELVIGMHICELDRPWQQTPFIIQGFYIKNINDIDTVRNICEYVFVDRIVRPEQLTKGLPGASSAIALNMSLDTVTATKPETRLHNALQADGGQQNQPYRPEQGIKALFPGKKLVKYSNCVSWRHEAANARQVIRSLYDNIVRFLDLNMDGNPQEFDKIRLVIEPMVNSVIR